MPGYRLTAKALQDVAEIVAYLHREANASIADRIETQLFRSFRDLGEYPFLGHLRWDLTARNVLFYTSDPYIILLRRKRSTTEVLRVIHGARDLRKFL